MKINDTSFNKIINNETDKIKSDKTKNDDNCKELQNIAYKTMLINGNNNIKPIHQDISNNSKIDNFLENESNANKKESWCKLDKTQKILKLTNYTIVLKDKYNLSDEETKKITSYLIKCLDRKSLNKTKDVVYDKDEQSIASIPNLIFESSSRNFILKKDEKHVSTVKCLPTDKKNRAKTIKILD
jgi:hypothetical protein